ncbi:transposable element Tcb1 transposase [Trichonephila clavipes]|nr:transposable element Tcb1 transposase [Trichonephila clavipes]
MGSSPVPLKTRRVGQRCTLNLSRGGYNGSHPPQCTTSRENRQIVRKAVTDHSVTSRTIAQHIDSVAHHSVSARTIRRRLHQSGLSARRPLLGLPLTQNHRCLRRQWCNERRMWAAEWNEVIFTDKSRICLQHHDGRIRVWRHRGERMLRPPHWSCTGYYSIGCYWISLSHSSSTHCRYFKQPALHLRGVGASCPSLPSGLGHSHISTGKCVTTRGTHCPKVLRQSPD